MTMATSALTVNSVASKLRLEHFQEPLQVDEETSLLGKSSDKPTKVRRQWWLAAIPCFCVLGVGSIMLLFVPGHHQYHHHHIVRRYRHEGQHHGFRRSHPKDSNKHAKNTDNAEDNGSISVAFIGNSMLYFNDIPRFVETLSNGRMTQDSCLHGDATLHSILETGNGMAVKFNTVNAAGESSQNNSQFQQPDLGACTVPMLLFGQDDRLEGQLRERQVEASLNASSTNETSYLKDDGTNPCFQNGSLSTYYYDYINKQDSSKSPHYDYIVLNDNTRNPGRPQTQQSGMNILQSTYLPWLIETNATLILLDTHAYLAPSRNLTEFVNVPTFTSRTFQGYSQYAKMLAETLPLAQKPRLALSGIAFLLVWEEDYETWTKLFHTDQLHCSPMGSYLEGLMIHYAIWQRLPDPTLAMPNDMSSLWANARVMQPADEPPHPFPTRNQAKYLYHVADRVAKRGVRPKSLVLVKDEHETVFGANP